MQMLAHIKRYTKLTITHPNELWLKPDSELSR